MRMLNRVGITAALLVSMVAAPAAAQNWRWDLGVNGGFSRYSALVSSDDTGLPDDVTSDDIRFDSGWLTGAQLTFWVTPNWAIRANGTYTDRGLEAGDNELIESVNLWSGSGDLMFRFVRPRREWGGMEFLPYIAVGFGRKWVNPAGDFDVCQDLINNEEDSCQAFDVTSEDVLGSTFALAEKSTWMGLVGLGADWRLARNFALRLEVNDRIYKPDVWAAEFTDEDGIIELTNGDDNIGNTVHEISGQLGLHLLMGLDRPQVVAVTPAPLPPPPPPAEPAPAPREDAITVCVIDPTASNGIRMQNALFLHASGDTVVVSNGSRIPLREAVGPVQVARNADWYVRGEPLTLTVGRYRTQYLTYQGATMIEPERLTFLGTINGYPVYANRDEVADFASDLSDLRRAQNSNDLSDILEERNDIRGELEDIRLLYVPLEPTGCIFQTVQMLEEVRKGKE